MIFLSLASQQDGGDDDIIVSSRKTTPRREGIVPTTPTPPIDRPREVIKAVTRDDVKPSKPSLPPKDTTITTATVFPPAASLNVHHYHTPDEFDWKQSMISTNHANNTTPAKDWVAKMIERGGSELNELCERRNLEPQSAPTSPIRTNSRIAHKRRHSLSDIDRVSSTLVPFGHERQHVIIFSHSEVRKRRSKEKRIHHNAIESMRKLTPDQDELGGPTVSFDTLFVNNHN